MKEKTDHKTTQRWNHAPGTAVVTGLVSQARDQKGRAETARYTLINENVVKDDFALVRGTSFADCNAETGDFGRKQILEE